MTPPPGSPNKTPEEYYRENEQRFIREWQEFLAFKSVSTDPAFDGDCRRCAEWLLGHLTSCGLTASLLETPTKPIVYAECGTRGPTVLCYGHYDVQPVEARTEWRSDPWTGEIREGRMYARGAQDNKGQLWYVIKAIERALKDDTLGVKIKFLIEGEEEASSSGLRQKLPELKEKFAADILLVTDLGTIKAGLPAITMGIRGYAETRVTVRGPRGDVHAGVHGGAIKNPAVELARLVASLHRPDGSVAAPGFYDGLEELTVEERTLIESFPLTDQDYATVMGVAPLGGEQGRSVWERLGARPCVEVNSIHAGYAGPGIKGIIPGFATATISMRTGAGQDPQRCLESVIAHLQAQTVPGVTVDFTEQDASGSAVKLNTKSPLFARTRKVIEETFGMPPILMWIGASVPAIAELARASGADPLMIGFGVEEDNIHAPNESFLLTQFRDGFRFVCGFLASFA